HRDLAFPSHRPCLSAPRGHLQTLPIPPVLHSLPTRRSSDLTLATLAISGDGASTRLLGEVTTAAWPRHLSVAGEYVLVAGENAEDRKSTRLNSSHVSSSYAVFCVKKKRHSNLYAARGPDLTR